jgi:hypothetical protein
MADTPSDSIVRGQLAQAFAYGGVATVLALGAVAIFFSKGDQGEQARNVLSTILPLVGTWVGTVLAFYFAKDNFESASRSTKELLGTLDERLRTVPVTTAMIPIDKATVRKLGANEKPDDLVLQNLADEMRAAQRQRLPILTAGGSPCLIFHLSTITDYLSKIAATPQPANAPPLDLKTKTVKNLRDEAKDLYEMATAFTCVAKQATLADAKTKMEAIKSCADVFVTESGQPSEPVLGWITNVEIRLRSQV